jgi:hypothetical protein
VESVYLSKALSPPKFWLGVSSNFVGSESGQIQSVKLLQNMVSDRTQHPQPLLATHCLLLNHPKQKPRMGGGPQTDKYLPLSPFTGTVL